MTFESNGECLRVAVIGGGYTGVAFAIHALRATRLPLALTIIEPAGQLGRGLAYSTTDPDHRINVPSDRMSLFGDDRSHATRWFFDHGMLPDADATDREGHHYPPRQAYGAYVAAVLADTLAVAGPGVRFEHRRAVATALTRAPRGWDVALADGDVIGADVVVLCFGHAAPTLPSYVDAEVRTDARFVADPWAPGAFDGIDPDSDVLIGGTGLTMADVVASLSRRGHRGRITAVSRRGLLPRTHGLFSDNRDALEGEAAPTTALALLGLLRRRIARDAPGFGWQPAVDALRGQLPHLWGALPPREKRKVLARLLPFWEVHRFRIAPQIHDAIERAREQGRLVVERAALTGVERDHDQIVATLRSRSGSLERRVFGTIILCTGPDKDIAANPLVASLLHAGLARLDDIGMGLDVDGDSRLLDANGTAQPDLLALGPMTRGTFGEMTGAPDITRHIEGIAPGVVAGTEVQSRLIQS